MKSKIKINEQEQKKVLADIMKDHGSTKKIEEQYQELQTLRKQVLQQQPLNQSAPGSPTTLGHPAHTAPPTTTLGNPAHTAPPTTLGHPAHTAPSSYYYPPHHYPPYTSSSYPHILYPPPHTSHPPPQTPYYPYPSYPMQFW